jgi:hypothetical protein
MAWIDDQSVVLNRMPDICISPQKTFPIIFDSYGDFVGNRLHPNRKQMKGSIPTPRAVEILRTAIGRGRVMLRQGVTAAFNLNLLARINRELEGDFRRERFAHEARWNSVNSAVEMHLVSLEDQTVVVDGQSFHFAAGESIHTETSRKYNVQTVSAIVESAGWYIEEMWTDPRQSFGVFGLASL